MNETPKPRAQWMPYGEGKFALMLDPSKRIPTDAVALVKPAIKEQGKWFWEHWPWMGQWGMAESLEEAKEQAGCPWGHLWKDEIQIQPALDPSAYENPHDDPAYQKHVEAIAADCGSDDPPCDACLAGGICDSPAPPERPTPRTDAVYLEVHKYEHPTGTYMLVQLCREIERELAEANAKIDARDEDILNLIRHRERLKNDVERLNDINRELREQRDEFSKRLRETAVQMVEARTERDRLEAMLKNPPKHQFWSAGESGCPKDIIARNGELHTMRCKKCGQENPRSELCLGGDQKEAER